MVFLSIKKPKHMEVLRIGSPSV